MSIFIYRNNQQFGPYNDAQVAEMLANGSLSGADAAIRQGDTEWKRLADLVSIPNTANSPAPIVEATAAGIAKPKKSRTGLLLGCGGFLVILVGVGAILGLLAYRNLNPDEDPSIRPSTIGSLKLKTSYPPKGDIWGRQVNYVALYEDDITKKSVIYMVTQYGDSSTADSNYYSDLDKSCKSERPISFSFLKDSKKVARGGTCGGGIFVVRDNKVAVVGGSADASTLVEFADKMPLTADTTRERE